MFDWKFLRNVFIKALILFIALNLLFVLIFPMNTLGKISFYNSVFPGRARFPFGENSQVAYNLSLYNINAMFASHEIHAKDKAKDEYRVFVIGDSSIWGTLLQPEETLSGYLNSLSISAADGRTMNFYNLGYPTLSLFKDIMLLEQAMKYQPDMIIWGVTLESLPRKNQLSTPLVAHNPELARALIEKYQLDFEVNDPVLDQLSFMDKTIIGQRRDLADLARLQIYGVMWGATGIDQVYLENFTPAQVDFEEDHSFHSWDGAGLPEEELAIELITAGKQIAGDIPVMILNEPMLISEGENSNIRYNFFYPRWAYDHYRQLMQTTVEEKDWIYLDYWDMLPAEDFTNSAIHLTPNGSKLLAEAVGRDIQEEFLNP